jgi:hypothetical protein
MRMDTEETLAESDENRNVEERIRGQLVQLNPVNKKRSQRNSWIGVERPRTRKSMNVTRNPIGG